MKTLSAAFALTGAAALVLIGATPAHAAGNAIDPGDSLYSISCDSNWNLWQLFGVDSTTAFSTKIGDGSGSTPDSPACAGQPAYDFTTGSSYYIQWYYDGDVNVASLAKIDTGTGASTTINEFVWVNGEFPTAINVDAIAIGPNSTAFALAEGVLYSLNLANADLTPVGSSLVDTYAFAYDQKTGQYYAIDDSRDIFTVDVTDGSFDYIDTVAIPGEDGIYSLQFDEAGTFWVQADEDSEGGAGLYSFTLATVGAPVYSGSFTDDPYYTEALLIVPGAALAATGTDLGAIVPLAAGAGALALVGMALLIVRRRRAA